MWERDRIDRYKREIQAISNAVQDPEDIAVILELETEFARVKADATRNLIKAGRSQREVARASGRHLTSVQQWLRQYPER